MRINAQALQLIRNYVALVSGKSPHKQSDTDSFIQFGTDKAIFALFLLIITPLAHAADLLFKSNFGAGVSLGAPYGFATKGAYQDITGTDK
ncbi:hypothetical protein, partial [Nitrosomonas oligotropha]|uniref:hypothetical protein n=1 Tax=Nitrosomonas oligotropha TaxID=42354 RepID=UPI001369CE8D